MMIAKVGGPMFENLSVATPTIEAGYPPSTVSSSSPKRPESMMAQFTRRGITARVSKKNPSWWQKANTTSSCA
ncbi:unannotated protein [freshwater metagenome]|uniref:Unannotated protein n=1 Tax=freshwater metagenome TaxID=449393 RepID=A0A6J7QB63_9ZZZZ